MVSPLLAEDKSLPVITLEPAMESLLGQAVRKTASDLSLVLDPDLARHLLQSVSTLVQQQIAEGRHPILICSPQIRIAIYRFLSATHEDLKVLSFADVPSTTQLKSVGVISAPQTQADNPELQTH